MHYAEVTCILNSTLFSDANYPRKHGDDIFETLFYQRALYLAAFYIGGKHSDQFNAE